MNYREILTEIRPHESFTSRLLAVRLGKPVKEISNDLIRIRKMGFLKKEDIPRECHLRDGSRCNRGFEKEYTLSKQGESYVKWMKNNKLIEDVAYASLMDEIMQHLPPDLQNRLKNLLLVRCCFKYKGPARLLDLFDRLAVSHIPPQNTQLAEENRALKAEISESNESIMEKNKQIETIPQREETYAREMKKIKARVEYLEECLAETRKKQDEVFRKMLQLSFKTIQDIHFVWADHYIEASARAAEMPHRFMRREYISLPEVREELMKETDFQAKIREYVYTALFSLFELRQQLT